jgi:hypothetical protein
MSDPADMRNQRRRTSTMPTRAAIGLISVMLALLGATPASADARCKDRPLKGTLSGFVTLTPANGNFQGDVTGILSRFGSVTAHQAGRVAPDASGHYTGSSTWSIVAANGDTLIGTATLDVQGPPIGAHTTTMVATVTGGTGRFAHASGTFTTVFLVTPHTPFNGESLVHRVEGTTTGQIRY